MCLKNVFLNIFLRINIILLFLCVFSVHGDDLTVNTTLGLIRGYKASDGDYYSYTGIPYAEIDRNNPFGASHPPQPFEGIFEANEDHYMCPQIEEFNSTLVGDLDCLRMNIFVPTTANSTNLLPVYFYIFGGSFAIGFNRGFLHGPKFLVRHDTVLVTINYRLGPYGFMCLDTPEVPGNQGLKDQLNALKWVHENIAAFGGDPSKITIGGNSAGSMSVDFHLLRQDDGPKLIDKAILQSGSSYCSSFGHTGYDAPFTMAQHLNFTTTNLAEALSFLAAEDPLTIIQATNDLNISFRPCIEQAFEGVEPFITKDWLESERLPSVKDMPIMMGINTHEGYESYMNSGFNYTINDFFVGTFDVQNDDFREMGDIARHFFYGDEEGGIENIEPGLTLISDVSFNYPMMRSLKHYLNSDAAKVYFYYFTYVGERNFVHRRLYDTYFPGAVHADEIGYLFDMFLFDDPPNDRDQVMLDRMTIMWANFMKYGDPTPETTELLPVKWDPVTDYSTHNYLHIDEDLKAGTSLFHDRFSFWDLFFEANRHLENRFS